jgi:hypothetical protein
MAARLDPRHDARTRSKIQTSQLVNRLQDHIFGVAEISPTQMKAIEILLRKTLPDLTTVAMTIDDKRDATDWTREELVAFLHNARNGGNGAATADGRDRGPDSVH